MTARRLDRLIPPAVLTGAADPRRRARVVAAFGVVLVVTGAAIALVTAGFGLWQPSLGGAIGAALAMVLLWQLRRGTSVTVLGAAAGALLFAIAVHSATTFGGFGAPPLNWLAVIPLLVLLVSGPRLGLGFAIAGVAIHALFFLTTSANVAAVPPLLRLFDGVGMAGFVFTLACAYEVLKRRALDEIEVLQARLVDSAHAAGMAEVAASVLHDVGNAMNQVTTAAALARQQIQGLRLDGLDKLARQLADTPHSDRDATAARYLGAVATMLRVQQAAAAAELSRLDQQLAHMTAMLASQQQHVGDSELATMVDLPTALQGVLQRARAGGGLDDVELLVDLEPIPPCSTTKHKVLLVFANLIRNAVGALDDGGFARRITVRLSRPSARCVRLEVSDTGAGIAPEHAASLFRHGFSHRADGGDSRLHGAAIAARELGGELTFQSDGRGRGASFVLELPFATGAAG